MNRPLITVVIAYATGLLLAQMFQAPLAALLTVSVLALMLAVVLKQLRHILIWPLLALVGWVNYSAQTAIVAPDDLRALVGAKPALAVVRGTLRETPSLRIYPRDEETFQRTVAFVQVTSLCQDNKWQSASGNIIATVPGVLEQRYFAGQSVEISGVLARPDRPVADGMFDYRSHLEKMGVYYSLNCNDTNDWRLGAQPASVPGLSDRFIAWAQRTLTLGLDAADKSTQLLLAMTLGQKTALTDEVSEPFMRSGTMHIFAISGLHIALIAGILLAVLRVVRVPRIACGFIVLPLLWFYTAATGWQPSAIRSTIMMSVIIGGWSLKRPSDLLNSLAAAAFIILAWDPRQLFQASFQLSFFVVLSIALFSPPLEKIRDRLLRTDPLLPPELLPRWRRWLDTPLRFLAASMTTSLAAWLGSLPLTAYYFHLFSPVTLLANVVIVPLAGFALMANLGGIICGTWLPWITEIFNNAAWFFMHLMVGFSQAVTHISGAWINVPAPSVGMIAIYFALLLGLTSGWLLVKSRRTYFAIISILLIFAVIWHWESTRDETEITVIPLNGGHAVYVDAAGRANDWLINCGNENAAQFTLKDFLRAQGVNQIPHLVLTTGAARHCGGANCLDDIFGVDELPTSGVNYRSAIFRNVVAHFQKSARHTVLNFGDRAGVWTVLFPRTNSLANANDSPLVLMGNFPGLKLLLLSDLSRTSQSDLLNQGSDIRADIVVAGLPDDSEPLCDALIEAIQPKVIVIADSEYPANRRAPPALKKRLEKKIIPVIYTRDYGAVQILTGKQDWRLQTMDGQKISPAVSSAGPKQILPEG